LEVEKAAVVGAGTMGHGIAELFAINDFSVNLMDEYPDALNKALKNISASLNKLVEKNRLSPLDAESILGSRIQTFSSIKEAVADADIVVEAVPESLELKRRVFEKLDLFASKAVVLATNTSNIRVSEIAEVVSKPERVVGMHFFNPPVIMRLVEIVKGEKTGLAAFEAAYKIAERLGKTPVKVLKDTPGFIVNRVQAPETLLLCLIQDKGVALPEEVDALFHSQGLPMGPYELMDYVGLDVVCSSLDYLGNTLHPDYLKCSSIRTKCLEKKLGSKTGAGFYDWSKGKPRIDSSKPTSKISLLDFFALEINEAVKLIEEGVVEKVEDIDTAVINGTNRPFGPVAVARSLNEEDVRLKLEQLFQTYNVAVFQPSKTLREGALAHTLKANKESFSKTKLERSTVGGADPGIDASGSDKNPLKESTGLGSQNMTETIVVERVSPRVAQITLDTPKHNAVNPKMLEELSSTLDDLWLEKGVNVILVRGSGDTFSSGADLTGSYYSSSPQFVEFARKGQRTLRKLTEIPKLTIAAIKGYALGGGLELALACDLRVAAEDAVLGFPELTLGLVPGWGGTQRLAKLVGISRANQLILAAERLTGKQAYEWGLVNALFPKEQFDTAVAGYADQLATTLAPVSLALAKRLVNKAFEGASDMGLEAEADAMGVLFSTNDLKEGVRAFMQKRKPEFKGN
jgi:enoyl-CoA hydratase/3-hydroxyacyl-CoA dehydrogenase